MHRELKTNGGMLPQSRPLEARTADNLQGMDETVFSCYQMVDKHFCQHFFLNREAVGDERPQGDQAGQGPGRIFAQKYCG